MDFTLSAYKELISTFQSQGYFFQTFEEYIKNSKVKVIILRHDVDRLPGNSLKTALLENELGIRATYFFRTIPQTFKPEIIKEIADLGHEIGYHYENLSEISRKKEVRSQKSEVRGQKTEDGGRRAEVTRNLAIAQYSIKQSNLLRGI